jgi:hypothetical protein
MCASFMSPNPRSSHPLGPFTGRVGSYSFTHLSVAFTSCWPHPSLNGTQQKMHPNPRRWSIIAFSSARHCFFSASVNSSSASVFAPGAMKCFLVRLMALGMSCHTSKPSTSQ